MSRLDLHSQLVLGTRGGEAIFLDDEARARHVYITGQTGTGKSTLLLNMIAQDLATGKGLALIDPHGDLAEAALAICPSQRRNIVYFDPTDYKRPIGLNPLANVPIEDRSRLAENIVAAFRHVWPEFWGPRLDYIFAHATRTLMDVEGSTLLYLPRLLTDAQFRAPLISQCTDPVTQAFWHREYEAYPDRFREEAIAPILNKLGRALMTPSIRNIIAQPKSSIDLRLMMDRKKVLIARLPRGQMSEAPAHLMGALLISQITQAAFSRAELPHPQRTPFHLYADEFQAFASDGFELILSEARKYGLRLTLAHQHLGQLPESLRKAVFGNAATMISFRVSAEDAEQLAPELDLGHPQQLCELANHQSFAATLDGRHKTPAFRLDPHPPSVTEPMANSRAHRLKKNSRLTWGRDHANIEHRIKEFFH